MKEIRIHGRGGQGSVTAAELLSIAAFTDGKFSQAFPAFGVERRGAPVQAFMRINESPIRIRSQIYEPDVVIVQDPTLLQSVNVTSGLKDNGILLINTTEKPYNFNNMETEAKIFTIDATKIAIDIIGRPIANTVLLGAFAAATSYLNVESLKKAVKERFKGIIGEKNSNAIQKAFDFMKEDM